MDQKVSYALLTDQPADPRFANIKMASDLEKIKMPNVPSRSDNYVRHDLGDTYDGVLDNYTSQPSGHYLQHPSGVEAIEITEHFNNNLGNVIKYVWRAGFKTPDPMEDLIKARYYVQREIDRLSIMRHKETQRILAEK
jgi:uncharacterized protein DUF3310